MLQKLGWDNRPLWSVILIAMIAIITVILLTGCQTTELEKQGMFLLKQSHTAGMNHLSTAMDKSENSTTLNDLSNAWEDFTITGEGIEIVGMGVGEPLTPVQYSPQTAQTYYFMWAKEKERNIALMGEIKNLGGKQAGGFGFGGILGTLGGLGGLALYLLEMLKRKKIEKVTGTTVKKVKAQETIAKESIKVGGISNDGI